MSRDWMDGEGTADEPGRDLDLAAALSAIDPGSADGLYWPRFRARVLENVAGELARRRALANQGVGEILASWSRALVPTALAAAAVAALLILRSQGALPERMTVEELLTSELEGETIPMTLGGSGGPDVVFATEGF